MRPAIVLATLALVLVACPEDKPRLMNLEDCDDPEFLALLFETNSPGHRRRPGG